MDCSGLYRECSFCRGRFAERPSGEEKLVLYTAVFRVVTQRSSCGEECCATTLKTAVSQTREKREALVFAG